MLFNASIGCGRSWFHSHYVDHLTSFCCFAWNEPVAQVIADVTCAVMHSTDAVCCFDLHQPTVCICTHDIPSFAMSISKTHKSYSVGIVTVNNLRFRKYHQHTSANNANIDADSNSPSIYPTVNQNSVSDSNPV